MSRIYFGGLGVAAFFALCVAGAPSKGIQQRPGLTMQQEPTRVVLKWNGAVEAPMLQRFQEAFEQLEEDERPILISLNSPGGFIEHGRDIMSLIHKQSRNHTINTIVEAGNSCASMCVPIYLVGETRMAHPAAKFMFHEASFRSSTIPRQFHGAAVKVVTDRLFEDDIGGRSVDGKWLSQMRERVRGRDVWLTGKQLMEQGSGVVDKLT